MRFKLFSRFGRATLWTRVSLWTIIALVFAGNWAGPALAQTKPPESEILPFLGTWMAIHAGTPIIVLHLSSQKGQLAGGIQVCSYTVNTETTGAVDVVTDPTLSKNLRIHNIKISGTSISFDWKDPDGDNDHWQLQLTGNNDGQILWVGLPTGGVKVQPIAVTKNIPKSN